MNRRIDEYLLLGRAGTQPRPVSITRVLEFMKHCIRRRGPYTAHRRLSPFPRFHRRENAPSMPLNAAICHLLGPKSPFSLGLA